MNTKIELDALQYVALRMRRFDVRAKMRDCECSEADDDSWDHGQHTPGVPACYREDVDNSHVDDWCEACQKRRRLYYEGEEIYRQENNVWRRLRRAMREPTT